MTVFNNSNLEANSVIFHSGTVKEGVGKKGYTAFVELKFNVNGQEGTKVFAIHGFKTKEKAEKATAELQTGVLKSFTAYLSNKPGQSLNVIAQDKDKQVIENKIDKNTKIHSSSHLNRSTLKNLTKDITNIFDGRPTDNKRTVHNKLQKAVGNTKHFVNAWFRQQPSSANERKENQPGNLSPQPQRMASKPVAEQVIANDNSSVNQMPEPEAQVQPNSVPESQLSGSIPIPEPEPEVIENHPEPQPPEANLAAAEPEPQVLHANYNIPDAPPPPPPPSAQKNKIFKRPQRAPEQNIPQSSLTQASNKETPVSQAPESKKEIFKRPQEALEQNIPQPTNTQASNNETPVSQAPPPKESKNEIFKRPQEAPEQNIPQPTNTQASNKETPVSQAPPPKESKNEIPIPPPPPPHTNKKIPTPPPPPPSPKSQSFKKEKVKKTNTLPSEPKPIQDSSFDDVKKQMQLRRKDIEGDEIEEGENDEIEKGENDEIENESFNVEPQTHVGEAESKAKTKANNNEPNKTPPAPPNIGALLAQIKKGTTLRPTNVENPKEEQKLPGENKEMLNKVQEPPEDNRIAPPERPEDEWED